MPPSSPEGSELDIIFFHLFLEDFPDPWDTRLLGHPRLRDRIGAKTTTVVTIGNDLQFEIGPFYGALAAMLETGTGETPTLDTTAHAVLTPSEVEERDGRFTIRCGDRTYTVIEEAMLLAHADPAVRQAVITGHPSWFDQSGAALEETASAIAGAKPAGERCSDTPTGYSAARATSSH
jgi:hypothetical protein